MVVIIDFAKKAVFLIFILLFLGDAVAFAQKKRTNLTVVLDSLNTGSMAGKYSLSVCDADVVAIDTVNARALAELLLCSELHGYVEQPNYYFSGHPKAMAHLDLLMLTQGWRRYDLSDMLNGKYPSIVHGIEQEQTIRGFVKTSLKKRPRNMRLVMFNPQTLKIDNFDLGDSSEFVISGIDYMEGETLSLEATRSNGSTKHVELVVEPVDVPKVKIPDHVNKVALPENINSYITLARQHQMYMNVDKVIELPNIQVKGKHKKWKNRLGIVSRGYAANDPAIERFPDIQSMLRSMGIMVRIDPNGIPFFGRSAPTFEAEGFTLTPTYIDNMLVTQEELWDIRPTDVSQVEYLAPNSPSNIIYGSEAVVGGCLLVYLKDGGKTRKGDATDGPASYKVRQIGYSPNVEFYSPQYPYDDSSKYSRPDCRTTLYWNPKVEVTKNGRLNCEFYHSDTSRRLLVTIEGVSDEGSVVSKCYIKE